MRTLQIMLIGFALLGIASLVSGIQSFEMTGNRTEVQYYASDQDWILSLLGVIFCGLGAFGIHRRSIWVWWGGWVTVGLTMAVVLWEALAFTVALPDGQKWMATGGVVLGFGGVGSYWLVWWKKQRPYFERDRR